MTGLQEDPGIWDDAVPSGAPVPRTPGGTGRDGVLSAVSMVLEHRRWIVGMGLAVFTLTVALKLTTPRTYSSTSRFVADAGSGRAAELSGLAAQFGVQLGGERNSYSPQFYIDLVRSATILRPAVEHRYTFTTESGSRTANLIEIYKTAGDSPTVARELAIRTLRADVRPVLSVKTSVVELVVESSNPELSAAINAQLLALLDKFNLETRRSRATIERGFLEARMKAVGIELAAAERKAEEFMRGNRQYDRSPELRFEFERLDSDVARVRQVYNSLAQGLEQAKVDEIRNTPVLTVVEAPVAPVWPNARGTVRAAALALVIGGMLGFAIGVLRDQWRRRVTLGGDRSAAFRAQLRDSLRDVGRFVTLGIWRPKSR